MTAYNLRGEKIPGKCVGCKSLNKAAKPHLDGLADEEINRAEESDNGNDTEDDDDDGRPSDCCMHRILSLEADFKSEVSLLEKVSARQFIHSFLLIISFVPR